jgi:hypothetical protein
MDCSYFKLDMLRLEEAEEKDEDESYRWMVFGDMQFSPDCNAALGECGFTTVDVRNKFCFTK